MNDKEITRNEVENMIRDHGDACIYYGEVLLCGVESADAIKKRLASEMNHKELDIVVSQDSLYERFKNDDEKVYFNRYDGRTVYGPNFDLEKGYALSELIDTVWIHYKEEHLEYSPECTTMLLDFAYLDCGQDGDPEMAIEFKNVGIYGAGDDSTLVLVIKEINGKLQCTYGDETWGRSGGVINSAGIMFSMGNHGAGQDGYALGILDANAEYHWVYGVDTSDFNTAYDFFSCEDGYKIFECDADINNEQYKFFVSNDPKISDNALFSTMHKKYAEYADIKSAKEVARIREQAKESYGITEEMLWLDPLFESSYCSYISGNPLEMVNYVSGKALGWD